MMEPQDDGQTNLIINYLPYTLTEAELTQLFGSIGQIRSTKVIRDRATGTSLGFGFVDYADPNDAARAIDAFDGLSLQSKRLKVAYGRQTEGVEGANVYVRNLDQTVSAKDVEEQFKQFGELVRARVLNDPLTGLSRGIAFVLFTRRDDAEQAVTALNGTNIPGFSVQPLCVRFAIDNSTKAKVLAANGKLVPNFNFPTPLAYHPRMPDPSSIAAPSFNFGSGYGAASAGGPIRTTTIRQRFNPLQMHPYESAAVRYADFEEQNAFPMQHGILRPRGLNSSRPLGMPFVPPRSVVPTGMPPLAGGILGPSVVMSPSSSQPLPSETIAGGYVLFVYNLEPDAKDSDLWELFGPFGAVKKVNVVYEKESSKCKGYGFVTMVDFKDAMAAVGYLNGFTYKDRVLQVSLKK